MGKPQPAKPLDLTGEFHPQNKKPYGISSEQARVILAAIREGAHFTTACRIAGVPYATFCDWMVKGGDEDSTDKDKPAPGEAKEPYASFVRAVREAEAYSELHMLRKLNEGAESDWRAAAFVLKSRHSDRWAEKPQGVQVNATGTVQFFLPDNGRQSEESDS